MRALILFALIGLATWWLFPRPSVSPDVFVHALQQNTRDSCASAERCVIVYLASWCPTCKKSVPLVKELRSYINGSDGKVGLRVVIGRGDEAESREYGRSTGGTFLLDDTDAIFSALKGRVVPSWWVLNAQGEILTTSEGIPAGGSLDQRIDYLIDSQLQLGDFL
jgi:thiol-disulfide isomerase/thioredoxin